MNARIFAVIALLWLYAPAHAQHTTPATNAVPTGVWSVDWNITRDINAIDGAFAESTSRTLSSSLLPVGIGVPAALFAGAHWQWFSSDATTNYELAETALLTVIAEVGTAALVVGIKSATSRERPYLAYPDRITKRADEVLSSFPSGHAAISASIATMLSLRYPKWYVIVPSALWSVGTSISRMHLGVHYFTDVVAGTALGAGVALLVYSLRADIAPAMDFLLPSQPATPHANAGLHTTRSSTPFAIGITPDGGVGAHITIPLGL